MDGMRHGTIPVQPTEDSSPIEQPTTSAGSQPECETLKPEHAEEGNECPDSAEGHVNPEDEVEDAVLKGMKNLSVWTYIYSELTRGYWLEHDEAKFSEKRKRVYTFMQIPRELEKFMTYGFFQCVDAFLYIFTLLPMRFTMALLNLAVKGVLNLCCLRQGRVLDPAQICDLLKGVLLISSCIWMEYVDVSMMYHIIRGQAIIKLYIFYNMLEVADRLFSSFGQDILDSLFWTASEPRGRKREHFGTIPHLGLAIVYVFLHAMLVLFQATTLNVAFNSHNKALLTIMMSNNFVELKGSVFKKFEKNNLFQMSCSDVRERFHFMVLLSIVCIRNLTEFSWNMDHLWVLVPDVVLVMVSEFLVDWVKHAFITKFNEIPSEVYTQYTASIAYDVANSRQKHAFSDHVDVVSRRMGFIPLPIAVLLVRVVYQSLKLENVQPKTLASLVILFYLCLLTLKVLISIVLLGISCDYIKETKSQKDKTPTPTKTKKATPAKTKFSDLYTPTSKDDLVLTSNTDLPPSGLHRRSKSVGRELNVTFSEVGLDERVLTDVSISDSEPPLNREISMNKPLFSNSTVSLQSVGLNEDFIKDKHPNSVDSAIKVSDMVLGEDKVRKKEPPKPLSEIDRYTMCSNRII